MKIEQKVLSNFKPLFQEDVRYIIAMGGRGAGRSTAASQYVLSRLVDQSVYTRGAIMRAIHSDIRNSSWKELKDRIKEQNVDRAFRIVDNEMEIEYGQNSIRAHGFKASSGSLTARLKSLANYNFLWIEEADEIGEQEFNTLDDSLRTVKGKIKIVLTLNTPSKNHWIIKRWFDLTPANIQGFNVDGFYSPRLKSGIQDAVWISGTFRDNLQNLDENTVKRYMGYRDTKPAHYWGMIEGLSPEVVMGRIYSGWRRLNSVPYEARLLGYGLDFGFDPDEAAITAIYYYNGGYILEEKLYQTKLLNEHLLSTFNLLPKAPIIADSAEPKSIAELQAGGLNIIPCEKGPDSVNYGIKHVQGLKISYIGQNLHNEYENYAWKVNKDGESLGIEDPKCANHLLSAARYGLSFLAGKNSSVENQVAERQIEIFARGRSNNRTKNDNR